MGHEHHRFLFCLCLFAISSVVIAGCGPDRVPTYPVKGKVVFKGTDEPAAKGAKIWFESTKPPDFLRSMSDIADDGTFVLSTDRAGNGAMEGEHRIRIDPTNGSGMNIEAELAKTIDRKYFEFRTSGVTLEIKPNEAHDFKIELDRPAGAAR